MLNRLLAVAAVTWLTTTATSASEPLPEKATDIRPLLIGASAPVVDVVSAAGDTVSLKSLVTGQASILVIYRGAW